MQTSLSWEFPLPRTHTGILQGNATMGVMIWGEGRTLRITIGRADFWDHRGGMPWSEKQNYPAIRACLEANDEEGINEIFKPATEHVPGQPRRPSVLPLGRIDLDLGPDAELTRGVLHLQSGKAVVSYRSNGLEKTIAFLLCMRRQLLMLEGLEVSTMELTPRPSWEFKGAYFSEISMTPPEVIDRDGLRGWVQSLPADPAMSVLFRQAGTTLALCTVRGDGLEGIVEDARHLLAEGLEQGFTGLDAETTDWWSAYWKDVPSMECPNPRLNELYAYGMYKLAGFTQPDGVAGTLQGPWIEEDELPPWSSDYHFNINVQMCYGPAFKGNRLAHLRPLFDRILSWEPQLRRNAAHFIGIEDGVMLPHAVDDRGTCMGSFWSGCIDHGCTAWVAQMMYDYASYGCDRDFLRNKAYPFMKATARVYEAMLDRDGDAFVLPVSVSPEYSCGGLNAWGANASFQLACLHRLCENLIAAADELGEEPEAVWREILNKLPKACLTADGRRIALWKGMDLEVSHRHHSHLAAITPFDTIDIHDPAWRRIVGESINRWIAKGMGFWSGWCIPWASMIHSRLGNGDMAELLLDIWNRVFTNEGRGTLHDCHVIGLTMMGANTWGSGNPPRRERMQLDAGMGAVSAIQDMLIHAQRGVHHIFPGVPGAWKVCSFEGMRCPGGFLVSAKRKNGSTTEVKIEAPHGGTFTLANPWANAPIRLTMHPGETRVLTQRERRGRTR